ncbi:glycosyltransferase family 4 protein [Compostibacter hankyongensis]|uniref:Glycosyltransferase family 4 protein n=1 Tax=Compostibacter hankyongensis TaxID=1007089 RepID=A0ABP8FNX7_9BACT
MKIAVLSPVAWRTPPRHYGPWEQIASNIAEGLHEAGAEVSLFATADSQTAGELCAVVPAGYEEDKNSDAKVSECMHISYLMEQAERFDIIHNHFDFLPLTYSRLIPIPMLTTIHGFSSPRIIPVYKRYNDHTHYVSVSNADRHPELNYTATVYHGLRTEDFPFGAAGGEYLLFMGRIHPDKGTWDAIALARRSGRQLLIAGFVQDQRYFEEKIKPCVDNEQIVYLGPADPVKRKELLRNAHALVHLIHFAEPFGLSVAEAMMCGTPVLAFPEGAMPELIRDGETGFLVPTLEAAVERVPDLAGLSREACHHWASAQFSRERMVRDYLAVYEQILGR